MRISKGWASVLSDFFVNLAAAWFSFVLIEQFADPVRSLADVILLTLRIISGIVSLVFAKKLREEGK